jgi:hypothetical protein
LPSAWDGRDREAKIFLESVLLLNTSSRTAGADLDSGHKMEPAQKKVVIASGLLPFLNHEAKAYAFKPLGHALPARCLDEAEIPECSASLAEQGAEIILCPSDTFTEYGFWRVRHCAQARAIENQIYFVHCCLGGGPGSPLPNGWARSSIISPCDVPWKNASGVIAEANPNKEMVIRGAVDLDVLRENREKGASTTFKDRRRRASIYANWPSHLAVHELAPPVSRY